MSNKVYSKEEVTKDIQELKLFINSDAYPEIEQWEQALLEIHLELLEWVLKDID